MPWFDAGVNLLDARFDIPNVIERANNAGVNKLCLITTRPSEWKAAADVYHAFPSNIVYTLGVHPHYAKDVNESDFTYLESLIDNPGVVAIGECGLDFNRNFSPPITQTSVFLAQLKLAKKYNKPVYLHERDAFNEQISCLRTVFEAESIRGIAHCFTGTSTQLLTYVELGLHIGITGWLCDPKRGEALRNSVKQLPNDKLILETDAPYLHPKHIKPRKRINEPYVIPDIAKFYANVTQQEFSQIEQISYTNSMRLFEI